MAIFYCKMPSLLQLNMRLFHILIAYIKTKYFRGFTDQNKLISYQNKRLKSLIYYVKKNSKFYSHLTKLDAATKMNKEIMMKNFNSINTKNIDKEMAMRLALKSENTRDFSPTINNITIGLSSGTSGNRGMFLASESEKAIWAGIMLGKLLPSGLLHKEKISLFLRANSNLYETLNSKKIQFKFFDLITPIDLSAKELEDYNPTILVAPPSLLRMLAQKKESGQIKLTPKKIYSAAEVLDPVDETYLTNIFDMKIDQIYQCTEGFLGHTCEYGTIHLNEDIVLVEKKFIDSEKTKFHPIITDFERRTQPVIRYELNDILTLRKDKCPCGSVFTAVSQIEGRADDVFYFENTNGDEIPVFPDFIRRRIISASDKIQEYRVVQESNREMVLYVKSEINVQDVILNSFKTFFDENNIILPTIKFAPYVFKQSLNKLKRVESHYVR